MKVVQKPDFEMAFDPSRSKNQQANSASVARWMQQPKRVTRILDSQGLQRHDRSLGSILMRSPLAATTSLMATKQHQMPTRVTISNAGDSHLPMVMDDSQFEVMLPIRRGQGNYGDESHRRCMTPIIILFRKGEGAPYRPSRSSSLSM